MTKKRDPIVEVLAYFEGAELALAQQGLALAQAIVRKRTPLAKKTTKRSPTRGVTEQDVVNAATRPIN